MGEASPPTANYAAGGLKNIDLKNRLFVLHLATGRVTRNDY